MEPLFRFAVRERGRRACASKGMIDQKLQVKTSNVAGESARRLIEGRQLRVLARLGCYGLLALLIFEGLPRVLLSIGPIFRRVQGRDESTFRIQWVRRHGPKRSLVYSFDIYNPTRG